MKILEQAGRELTKREIYKMTMDAGIISMKDVEDGTLLEVEAYIGFMDKDDSDIMIHSVLTSDGQAYAFQSQTFADSLLSIYSIMGEDEKVDIIKISGKTKAGRDFINCKLA